MEHYTEKQYDDDLTVVADEYDASFQTDNVDLFEFPTHDESPLARLKSLVLSIDWEITDEVLHQFNEELVDLKDVWAEEKLYLVYIQALEKISKYIYKEKADAHPNAIKLLLSFYYDLEKMVSSESMTEEEKHQLLLEDVRKFEILKKQIGRGRKTATVLAPGELHADELQPPAAIVADAGACLLDLKAIVLGIDWEITESELERLRDEVQRLETVFADSRPKQIFLQGLGSLAAYIRLKKSDAHADAFTLLHSLFTGLEKIVTVPMSLEEEKRILLPEVEKFNEFKALIREKGTSERIEEEGEPGDQHPGESMAPALAGLSEEERGFQEEEEVAALGRGAAPGVEERVDQFFTDRDEPVVAAMAVDQPAVEPDRQLPDIDDEAVESRLDSLFEPEVAVAGVAPDRETALQGCEIETEAEEDSAQDRLRLQPEDLAPALSELDATVMGERVEAVSEESIDFAADVDSRLDDFFGALDGKAEPSPATVGDGEPEAAMPAAMEPAAVIAPPGVDVEADEGEDAEGPLTLAGGDLAPALSGDFEGEAMAVFEPGDEVAVEGQRGGDELDSAADIEDRLDSFFGEEAEPAWEDRPVADTLPSEVPGETLGEVPPAALGAIEGPEADEEGEALVFEPVEEAMAASAVDAMLDAEFAAVFEGVEEPGAGGSEIATPPVDRPAIEAEAPTTATDDPLATLRACVGSLGLEFDDSIFDGLRAEIARLRRDSAMVPAVGAFLQLIATVARHIETYRYESSAEAFNILQALTEALGRTLAAPQGSGTEDMLLEPMTTVLQWQQDMLDRQAVTSGGRPTFAVPLRTTAGTVFAEEEIAFGDAEIARGLAAAPEPALAAEIADGTGAAVDFTVADEPLTAASEEMFAAEELAVEMEEVPERAASDSIAADSSAALAGAGADGERLARQMRELIVSEVESLRQEIQSGMESLRRDLLGNKP